VRAKKESYGGGLVGLNAGGAVISTSYATGEVRVEASSGGGGLVGGALGGILNSYAEGAVSGSSGALIGGLVGDFGGYAEYAYSTGAVSGGAKSYVGGFIGYDEVDERGEFVDCYWDTDKSGVTNLSQGAGNIANDAGITGQTTSQLKAGLPAGFDTSTWNEKAKINGGLPYLLSNSPAK
jgi:hypothetical protein